MNPITDPQEVAFNFGILYQLIALHNRAEGFRTQAGPNRRDVDGDEFMLMCGNDTTLQFKHRDTRNYVYLRRPIPGDPWKLEVPINKGTFNLGLFDKFEMPVG